MQKVSTLYSSYAECMLDIAIFGRILSAQYKSLEERKQALFEEFKLHKPAPTLEDKRYELSRHVSSDYNILYDNDIILQDNEELFDLHSGVAYSPADMSDAHELPEDVTLVFSYENGITDDFRAEIIKKYDLDTGEEFKIEVSEENSVSEMAKAGYTFSASGSEYEVENFEDDEADSGDYVDSDDLDSYISEDDDDIEDYEDESEDDDLSSYMSDDESEDSEDYEESEDDDLSSYMSDDESEDSEDYEESEDFDDDEESEEYEDSLEDFDDDEESEEYEDDDASEDFEDDDYSEDYEDDESFEDYGEDDESEEDDLENYSDDFEYEGIANEVADKQSGVPSFEESQQVVDLGIDSDIDMSEMFTPDDVVSPVSSVKDERGSPSTIEMMGGRGAEPTDLRQFLRKYPRSEISFVRQYFSQKQIDEALKRGKIIKKGNILRI